MAIYAMPRKDPELASHPESREVAVRDDTGVRLGPHCTMAFNPAVREYCRDRRDHGCTRFVHRSPRAHKDLNARRSERSRPA